jgi:hypothetical protein
MIMGMVISCFIIYLIGSVFAIIITKYYNKKINNYNSIYYINFEEIPIIFIFSWISIIIFIINTGLKNKEILNKLLYLLYDDE